MRSLSITAARKTLLDLPDGVQDEPVFVTRHGQPVLAVLSMDQYEGMVETIEILSDRNFVKRLQVSLDQVKEGCSVSLEEAASRLGL